VKRLFVGAGTGRGSAEGALGHDNYVDFAPFQFDRRPQASGSTPKDEGVTSMHGQLQASRRSVLAGRSFVGESRHSDVGEAVEDLL
jgi:hypothetical protein